MVKTVLNAHLVTTRLKRFLSPQFCWLRKIRCVEKFWFGFLMKSMISLILLFARLIFSQYEFLVFFRQVRLWDWKSVRGHGLWWSVGRVWVRSVWGGSW